MNWPDPLPHRPFAHANIVCLPLLENNQHGAQWGIDSPTARRVEVVEIEKEGGGPNLHRARILAPFVNLGRRPPRWFVVCESFHSTPGAAVAWLNDPNDAPELEAQDLEDMGWMKTDAV